MKEQESSELLVAPPSANHKRWIGIGICVFLILQVVIPASYYFGNEPTSERFAWRMFSTIHMSTWETSVVAMVKQGDGKTVAVSIPLEAAVQETFVNSIREAQLDVVRPFLESQLALPGVVEVRFLAQGTLPSGSKMAPIRLKLSKGDTLKQRTQ